ncbi:MAG: PKD domain-containing protein [Verrucomicrobia bacterium]|nr:PKD domain-containing protein [Verrucomicrobiota bacterium]
MKALQSDRYPFFCSLTAGVVALAAACWWLSSTRPSRDAAAVLPVPAAAQVASAPAAGGREEPPSAAEVPAAADESLRQWLEEFRQASAAAGDAAQRAALLRDGLRLAEARRERMIRLIREEPRQALAEALRFDEYASLPEAVRRRVERPFSDRATYSYLPVCAGPGGNPPLAGKDHVAELALPDGTTAKVSTYGRRAALTSKRWLPATGIEIGGLAALEDRVFHEVTDAERATALERFPCGQADATRSFATGRPLAGAGILALAGDRLFTFADRGEMERMDGALAALDDLPGPDSGSSVLFRKDLPLAASGGCDSAGAGDLARQLASEWTETRKKVFLIRVDFSDHVGEPVTQAAASGVLNGPCAEMIRAMSYGKTWIEAGVSAQVYRLPQSAAHYAGGDLSSELLRDARNTFRNTRSGADAAVNIGPVSATGNGGDGGLGDFHVVGVFCTGIGMNYAGLATVGGGDLWVQDGNNAGLYVHELVHNYGLGHASFWQTTDGSVAGAGASEEYGDIFDIAGSGPAGRGHVHPQGKARLNWLAASQWTDATAAGSGTYRVYRIDDAATVAVPRGLRVTRSSVPGNESYYWLGYRPAFDDNPYLQRGAYLVWQRPAEVRCWLLDTTPGTADGKADSPLGLGRTYSDTAAGVHLTPLGVGGTGAGRYLEVRVNLGPFPGNRAPVIASFTGPAAVAARTQASYTAAATDADADPLAFSWDAADRTPSENSNATTRSWMVGGTYSLGVTASDMKGGKAVASKTVVVTDPLDTWSSANAGTTANLEDVLWAKGRCVGVDFFGGACFSWDGASWDRLGTLPGFEAYTSYRPQLAFGAGTFVVAGKKQGAAAAQLAYSADGRRWREASFPAGVPQTMDVAYGAGQFVAVGDSGTVMRSANGIQWTFATVPGSPHFSFLAYDGTTWLAVAQNASGYAERLWTSPDAVAWTQRDLLGMQTFGLFAIGTTAYAVGWYGGLKYSTDHGLNWQNAALPGTTQWSTYHLAAADDGTLLLTGQAMSESGSPRALLVSTDGRTWSRASGNAEVASTSHALAFGGGRFISVGEGGVTRQCASFYPGNHPPVPALAAAPATGQARQAIRFAASATDGDGDLPVFAWDLGPQFPIFDGFEIAPIFPFGGDHTLTLRVSDGRGGLATLTHTVTVNDPARLWTQRSSGTTTSLTAVAVSPATVVAVGGNGTVLTSANGSNWFPRTLPDWGGNLYLDGAAWDGTRFHIAGVDYDWDVSAWVGVIYSSSDGVTWTRRYKSSTGDTGLHAVASGGGASVAVGNNGTVLHTANGITWTPVAVPGLGSPTVSGAAYGGGKFLLVAYSGGNGTPRSFSSTNGLSWLDGSGGIGLDGWQDLRKVAWLNDRFVASGFFSKLRISTDGGSTFTSTRTRTEELPAMAYGSGCWFTAGLDRDAGDAAVDVMSLDGSDWISFAAPSGVARTGAAFFNGTFITVGEGGSIWQSGALSPPGGWSAWQSTRFPAGSAACLPDRDPDGDGLPNLVEYALGRDPNSATAADGPGAAPTGAMTGARLWLHFSLPDPVPADVDFVVQGSPDLRAGSWTSVCRKNGTSAWQWLGGGTSRLNVAPPSGGRTVVDAGVPDSGISRTGYFLRLTVELP